jgi:hypothetical protein
MRGNNLYRSIIYTGVIFSIISLFPGVSIADNKHVATTAGSFLKIDVGVRSASMGSAFGAAIGDPVCVYYNPAGLAHLGTFAVSCAHVELFQGIRYEHIGISRRIKIGFEEEARDLGVGACNINYIHVDNIKGNYLVGNKPEPAPEFKYAGYLAVLSYARYFTKKVLFGINFKVIKEDIELVSATTVGFDIGILYWTDIKNLITGICLQNIGNDMKFMNEKAQLPLNLKASIGYAMLDYEMVVFVDINKPIDNKLNIRAGVEYWLLPWLAIRAGYRSDVDIGSGFGYGWGIKLMRRGEEKVSFYNLDYAFVPYKELESTHRVSISIEF